MVIDKGYLPKPDGSQFLAVEVKWYSRPDYYAIDYSTNLIDWETRSLSHSVPVTNTHPVPAVWYIDTTAGSLSNRFYRLRQITSADYMATVTNFPPESAKGDGWIHYSLNP